MIALPINVVEAVGLPTGASVSMPQGATPDFAALFASVAAVAPEGAPGAAIPSTSDPMALVLPTQSDLLPIQTPLEMPIAQTAPAPLSVTPPASTALDLPKVGPVAQGSDVAIAAAQEQQLAAVQKPDVGETPDVAAEPVLLLDVTALFVAGPDDQPVDENVAAQSALAVDRPVPSTLPVADRTPKQEMPIPDIAVVAIAATVVGEPAKRVTATIVERIETPVVPSVETRATPLVQIPDKPFVPTPDRAVPFAAIVSDAVRDLVTLASDKDVRFNVRPELLGPVAVTIERTDAGPTLRLGVETQAAVQAVKQAEPTMNDARGSAPFVQITVDMNAPDSRGRSARAMPPQRAAENHVSEQMQYQLPVSTGRYA